jgi:hypothetical protein
LNFGAFVEESHQSLDALKLARHDATCANIQAPYPTTLSREAAVSSELHNESRRALKPWRPASTRASPLTVGLSCFCEPVRILLSYRLITIYGEIPET